MFTNGQATLSEKVTKVDQTRKVQARGSVLHCTTVFGKSLKLGLLLHQLLKAVHT